MKIKDEKGAISLFVIISGIFLIAFFTTTFIAISVKKQTQDEATRQTLGIYSQESAEEAYESFFGEGQIPISSFKALQEVGTGHTVGIDELGGKYFEFSTTAEDILMDNIVGEYNGVWSLPELDAQNNGRIVFNGKTIKIKDTSKTGEDIYYYYDSSNDYSYPITSEGYSYNGLQVFYDGKKD